MSNLHQTSRLDNEESESEDDDEEEDEEKKPNMSFAFIKHQGCVNRIRVSCFIIIFHYLVSTCALANILCGMSFCHYIVEIFILI